MEQYTVHPTTSIFTDINSDLAQITSKGRWTEAQKTEIIKGLKSGVNVFVYANPKYSGWQMEVIREGLEQGLDVSIYADPSLSDDDMMELREDLLRRGASGRYGGIKRAKDTT